MCKFLMLWFYKKNTNRRLVTILTWLNFQVYFNLTSPFLDCVIIILDNIIKWYCMQLVHIMAKIVLLWCNMILALLTFQVYLLHLHYIMITIQQSFLLNYIFKSSRGICWKPYLQEGIRINNLKSDIKPIRIWK